MFKELLLLCGVITPYITSPSNAVVPVGTYEVVNATAHNVNLIQAYSDEFVSVSGKTKIFYPYSVQSSDPFDLYISKSDYPTMPNDFYYILKASDFEDPIPIVFNDVPSNVWHASISGYGPATGLQIGRFEALNGIHAYIDVNKFGISMNYGLSMDRYNSLLPEGATCRAVLTDGTTTGTLSELLAYKSSTLMTGPVHMVGIYGNSTHDLVLASNLQKGSADYQPTLAWRGLYKNEFVFGAGNKVVRYGEMEGSLPYYFTLTPQGYISYDSDSEGVFDTLTASMGLVGTAISLLTSALGWVVFPGVTIGLLLLIPILIGLLVWLIRFLKKG